MSEDVEVEVPTEATDNTVVVDITKPDEKIDAKPDAKANAAPDKPKPDIDAEDGVAELKAQLEEFRQKSDRERQIVEQDKQRREQEAAVVASELARLKVENQTSRITSVVSGIAAAKAEGDAAQRDYVTFLTEGKVLEAAEAQRRMSRAESRVASLETQKETLEASRPPAHEGRVAPKERQPVSSDPLEQKIAHLTPRTQGWLRNHPECVNDEVMNSKMMAAHYLARSNGFIPDSDAYFDYVEKDLGFKNDGQSRTPVRAHTRAVSSAPVSREAPEGSPTRIKLSGRQQDAAAALGLTNTEYARRMVAMQKNGWFDRS